MSRRDPAKATGRAKEPVAVKARKPFRGEEHEAEEGKRPGKDGRAAMQGGPVFGSTGMTDDSHRTERLVVPGSGGTEESAPAGASAKRR